MGIIDKFRARESDGRRADAQARRSATGPTTEVESHFETPRDSSTVVLPTMSAPTTLLNDTPSQLPPDFADSRMQPPSAEAAPLPLLGKVAAPVQRVAMIALAGCLRLQAGQHDGLAVRAQARWPMESLEPLA